MKKRLVLVSVIVGIVSSACSLAQAQESLPSADPNVTTDTRILAEIKEHSDVTANLEYLSDLIGPRLTGSDSLKRANEWTAEMFRKYGLSNVHLEPWTIVHSWTRETAHAHVLSPSPHPLRVASAEWSASTPGVVRGPVIYVESTDKFDLEKFHGRLRGAVVITSEPQPPLPALQFQEFRVEEPPLVGNTLRQSPLMSIAAVARRRGEFFKEEGVAAMLLDSSEQYGLRKMATVGSQSYGVSAVPTAFVTGEDYRLIWRLLQRGPVELELEMTNSFSERPVDVYNTVAEIRGSEKPDEIVILGAHLDSSDLGAGAIDNAYGSVAVLEAARALTRLGLQPKRTIRFVLFAGQEQGLVGSVKYVEAHKRELGKISGVLVHETKTGQFLRLGLQGNYQDREIVDRALAPLGQLRLLETSMQSSFESDHASFDAEGVPSFFCIEDFVEGLTSDLHRSMTPPRQWPSDLNDAAQVLAEWAYNVSQLPEMLPRRPARAATSANKLREPPAPDVVAGMDEKIFVQVKAEEKELLANLEYLADHIGPRVTGSSQLDEASHWSADQFRKYGLTNVHLEPWTMANGWSRGSARARIIAPAEQRLDVAAAGWSPSTKKPLRGRVVGVKATTLEELEQFKGKLRGAIVLAGPPLDWDAPRNPMLTPLNERSVPTNSPHLAAISANQLLKVLSAEIKFFKDEGVAAALFCSDKSYGLQNIYTETGREYSIGTYPLVYATRESYTLIWRLLESGPVKIELEIHNKILRKPVKVYNTVAELPGSEKPGEAVIIAGHLDSWDLGTGATDDGTGAMAVLEAAHALQKLSVKPKRTIRFILFTGEEQGMVGSRAYVDAHKAELSKISAALIDDNGTGRILTIGMMGNYAARETMDNVLYPLTKIAIAEPSLRSEHGSDYVSFDEVGIPGFWCIQDPVDYALTHHSQGDTFDKVRGADLTQGAQLLAAWAFNVAELPDLVPRKPSPTMALAEKKP